MSDDLIGQIKQLKAERKRYFDVEGDGVDVVLNRCWDEIEGLRKRAEGLDSALRAFTRRAFQHRDGNCYWGSDPTLDEVQAARSALQDHRHDHT